MNTLKQRLASLEALQTARRERWADMQQKIPALIEAKQLEIENVRAALAVEVNRRPLRGVS